jgi:hypothetical protein
MSTDKTVKPVAGSRQMQLALIGLAAPLALAALPAFANDSELVEEARRAANRLMHNMRTEINAELERTGPIRAITVCKYSAPELSSSISRQTGMRVTRISLKPRNPNLGEADAWEQKYLLDFEKRLAKGEKADSLEVSQVVTEPAGRYFRYVKAIPMGTACVACHGTAEQIPEGVKATLANDYPRDRAINYQIGQLRGAVSVKKLLD